MLPTHEGARDCGNTNMGTHTIYTLNNSNRNTKTMVFLGRNPVRTKISTDNNILVQVSHYNYLDYILCRKDKETGRKLNTLSYTIGTIRQLLMNKIYTQTH